MSIDALDYRAVTVRHVTNAVYHQGLFSVLRLALRAWWNRPRLPHDMPARLREDMGLPPAPPSLFSFEPNDDGPIRLPVWMPRT